MSNFVDTVFGYAVRLNQNMTVVAVSIIVLKDIPSPVKTLRNEKKNVKSWASIGKNREYLKRMDATTNLTKTRDDHEGS